MAAVRISSRTLRSTCVAPRSANASNAASISARPTPRGARGWTARSFTKADVQHWTMPITPRLSDGEENERWIELLVLAQRLPPAERSARRPRPPRSRLRARRGRPSGESSRLGPRVCTSDASRPARRFDRARQGRAACAARNLRTSEREPSRRTQQAQESAQTPADCRRQTTGPRLFPNTGLILRSSAQARPHGPELRGMGISSRRYILRDVAAGVPPRQTRRPDARYDNDFQEDCEPAMTNDNRPVRTDLLQALEEQTEGVRGQAGRQLSRDRLCGDQRSSHRPDRDRQRGRRGKKFFALPDADQAQLFHSRRRRPARLYAVRNRSRQGRQGEGPEGVLARRARAAAGHKYADIMGEEPLRRQRFRAGRKRPTPCTGAGRVRPGRACGDRDAPEAAAALLRRHGEGRELDPPPAALSAADRAAAGGLGAGGRARGYQRHHAAARRRGRRTGSASPQWISGWASTRRRDRWW